MKTQKKLKYQKIFKIFMVVPIVAIMLLAASSCNESKKTEPLLPEVAPPPPPPPPVASDIEPDSVYRTVDLMPTFPGGDAALLKLIGDSVKYPVVSKNKGIQGKVIVQFVIDPTGNVRGAKILRGADPLLDAEALRVVQQLPKFEPGFKDGKAVSVYFTVPIQFRLI